MTHPKQQKPNSNKLSKVSDSKHAALTLFQAFQNDPNCNHMFSNVPFLNNKKLYDQRRFEYFKDITDLGMSVGQVHSTPNYECVIVCSPPGRSILSPYVPRTWMFCAKLVVKYGVQFVNRFIQDMVNPLAAWDRIYIPQCEAAVARNYNYWYIMVIGTKPEHQGKGHLKTVLKPILAQADLGGHCVCLEAVRRELVPVYERYGFEVVDVTGEEESDLLFYMIREPLSV